MKLEFSKEIDERLLQSIYQVFVNEGKSFRSETTPGNVIKIDGIEYKSDPVIKYFRRSKKQAGFESYNFSSMYIEDYSPVKIVLEYSVHRSCGEYDDHWVDLDRAINLIGSEVFFTKEEAEARVKEMNAQFEKESLEEVITKEQYQRNY